MWVVEELLTLWNMQSKDEGEILIIQQESNNSSKMMKALFRQNSPLRFLLFDAGLFTSASRSRPKHKKHRKVFLTKQHYVTCIVKYSNPVGALPSFTPAFGESKAKCLQTADSP